MDRKLRGSVEIDGVTHRYALPRSVARSASKPPRLPARWANRSSRDFRTRAMLSGCDEGRAGIARQLVSGPANRTRYGQRWQRVEVDAVAMSTTKYPWDFEPEQIRGSSTVAPFKEPKNLGTAVAFLSRLPLGWASGHGLPFSALLLGQPVQRTSGRRNPSRTWHGRTRRAASRSSGLVAPRVLATQAAAAATRAKGIDFPRPKSTAGHTLMALCGGAGFKVTRPFQLEPSRGLQKNQRLDFFPLEPELNHPAV